MKKMIFAALLASVGSAQATPTYVVKTLGNFSGNYSFAKGINDSGQVIGSTLNIGLMANSAFVSSDGEIKYLGSLGGTNTNPFGINSAGKVVGWSSTANTFESRAFMYSDGVMTDLGTLGGSYSSAYAINNLDQIAGFSCTWECQTQSATIFENGTLKDIGWGYFSGARGINDAGQMIGYSLYINEAFIYESGRIRTIGTLGGQNASATAISNSGNVAGYSLVASNTATHAFLYESGVMKDLGTLGGLDSVANGVNDLGQVVGWSSKLGASSVPFLYSNNSMVDLNSLIESASGWTILDATGINRNQQIAATACNLNGCQAVRLDPVLRVEVPEPSSFTLLLAGLGILSLVASSSTRRKTTV